MMMKLAVTIIFSLSVAGCVSARFPQTSVPPRAQATPQQQPQPHRDLGGPYTREREDREFEQP
jgi:hypothetical protein